ncbi:hypothetical protein B1A_11881 [mine drainage metagenome]|uniref:Uncharacterized protein n=1 Tax=mine drainage metagenome TaxID=410659 RepID=T1BQX5_9ZZZZ
MNGLSQTDLPIFEPQVNPCVRAAAARLVAFKHVMDDALAPTPTINPIEFVRSVIPFLSREIGPGKPGLVPSELVIGESSKFRPEDLCAEERQARRASALSPSMADPANRDRAEYWSIVNLGLFVAHEGKHRVRLLRESGDALIPALVSEIGYPDPSRISRYAAYLADRRTLFYVLDGRWMSWPAPCDAVSCLLDAYDVPLANDWPASLPALGVALAAFSSTYERLPAQRAGQLATRDRCLVDLNACEGPTPHEVRSPWWRQIAHAMKG